MDDKTRVAVGIVSDEITLQEIQSAEENIGHVLAFYDCLCHSRMPMLKSIAHRHSGVWAILRGFSNEINQLEDLVKNQRA